MVFILNGKNTQNFILEKNLCNLYCFVLYIYIFISLGHICCSHLFVHQSWQKEMLILD